MTGCSQTTRRDDVALENVVVENDFVWDGELPELMEVILRAEALYDEGSEFYKGRQWTKARDAFDQALEVLLEADVDAETHYRLSQSYDKLFFPAQKVGVGEGISSGNGRGRQHRRGPKHGSA